MKCFGLVETAEKIVDIKEVNEVKGTEVGEYLGFKSLNRALETLQQNR